jgi:hypothetical protein
MGGERRARRVGERPLDRPPVLRAREDVARGERRSAAEVPVEAEDIGLGLLGEERSDLQRMAGRQAQPPAGRGAAARDLDDHLGERLDVDLEAAEHPRDEHPVEARAEELGVGLLRVARVAFGLLLAFEQRRAQGLGAGDELGW